MMTGFINIDKEEGISSAREVSVVKRLTKTPCGHMGTLDPMASGVLPVAIGNAARLFDYFLGKKKTYLATFRFGMDSDTLDTTGSVTATGGYVPAREEIEKVLPSLVGEILQVPPNYSAKNVNGKRGYQLARQGVEFSLPPKKVTVHSIEILDGQDKDSYRFKIECGGGTYIRSIARDMAKMLGTCAVMSALRRTESGVFCERDSVKSGALTEDNISQYIIPADSVLPFGSIYPEGGQAKRLFNGLAVESNVEDGIYKIYSEDKRFYGLAVSEKGLLKVRKKLC